MSWVLHTLVDVARPRLPQRQVWMINVRGLRIELCQPTPMRYYVMTCHEADIHGEPVAEELCDAQRIALERVRDALKFRVEGLEEALNG